MINTLNISADRLIQVSGWLFIFQAGLISIILLLKLTIIPIDALESEDLSAYEPLLAAGFFFIGRGILKKKEWIRGIALWILWLRLIISVPLELFTETNNSIWIILIDSLINVCLILFLTRPNVKKCFIDKQANQSSEPTLKSPGDSVDV
jgi:hypothetical protein